MRLRPSYSNSPWHILWSDYYFNENMLGNIAQEEGNENMEKRYAVLRPNLYAFKTYEEAEKTAKKYTAQNGEDFTIGQCVAVATSPIPDIVVTKLDA